MENYGFDNYDRLYGNDFDCYDYDDDNDLMPMGDFID